jgi:hypothetical protein
MASRSQERNFFRKKSPAAVHLTHTGHKNTRNAILSEKKAPAAVHHTHTPGFKIPGTSFFPEKKTPAAVHHTHRADKSQESHFLS